MVCICWRGFPQYGARCVRAFVRSTDEKVAVIAFRPDVPIMGMEETAGCPVYWIQPDDNRKLTQIVGEMPRCLMVSGWSNAVFNRFRDEVHASGGRVLCGVDNCFEVSLKNCLRALNILLRYSKKYDAFWVPGKSGRRLLRFSGIPEHKIITGSYTADAEIFNDGGIGICERPKRIIFVGRLNERKNPIRMCRAFKMARGHEYGWSLDLFGCGPLKDQIEQGNGVVVHDFLQPEQLAEEYRQSRVFCLPSIEEHWGLVVHEAALSGCFLLLSDAIGAKDDFIGQANGLIFKATSERSLVLAMQRVMNLTGDEFVRASEESKRLGASVSVGGFVKGLASFVETCR